MSIFVFSSATGAVPVSDAALPVYFLIANLGALLGGIVVSFGLDWLGRKPTVTLSYLLAALRMLGVAAAAGTGSAGAVLAAFTVAAFFRDLRVGVGLPDLLRAVPHPPAGDRCRGQRRGRPDRSGDRPSAARRDRHST
ncbi:MAG: hypothetical protein M3Y73_18005 [Actinomycetota bacterium]|nr:hypothetical protein [Actinomycetota bacterium]